MDSGEDISSSPVFKRSPSKKKKIQYDSSHSIRVTAPTHNLKTRSKTKVDNDPLSLTSCPPSPPARKSSERLSPLQSSSKSSAQKKGRWAADSSEESRDMFEESRDMFEESRDMFEPDEEASSRESSQRALSCKSEKEREGQSTSRDSNVKDDSSKSPKGKRDSKTSSKQPKRQASDPDSIQNKENEIGATKKTSKKLKASSSNAFMPEIKQTRKSADWSLVQSFESGEDFEKSAEFKELK